MQHRIGNERFPLFLTTRKKRSYNSRQMIKSILNFWWICTITAPSTTMADMSSSGKSSSKKISFSINSQSQEQTIWFLENSYYTETKMTEVLTDLFQVFKSICELIW